MPAFETLIYEKPKAKVARITLNRPERRNAHNARLLRELDEAFDVAARDETVKVIILAAAGPHFSAGQDLRDTDAGEDGWSRAAATHVALAEGWRNLPKPTIAQVQGKVVGSGLMLIWACDIIIAADNASFVDNSLAMGVCGAEYFSHPWELGPRKAKEMLFAADRLSAHDAHRLGMVNHVVPPEELPRFTAALADRIAERPGLALKWAKAAVNAAEDAQNRPRALQRALGLHCTCYDHNMQIYGTAIDPHGIPVALKRPAARKASE